MENTKKSLQGKSVLITGGAGFIGSHLTDRVIVENPSQVIVVDNFFLGVKSDFCGKKIPKYRNQTRRCLQLPINDAISEKTSGGSCF
jgi:UDP-glucose 4-epimerase